MFLTVVFTKSQFHFWDNVSGSLKFAIYDFQIYREKNFKQKVITVGTACVYFDDKNKRY